VARSSSSRAARSSTAPSGLRNVALADQPNDDVMVRLIERGQRERSFDPDSAPHGLNIRFSGCFSKAARTPAAASFPVTPSPRSSSARSNAVSARST